VAPTDAAPEPSPPDPPPPVEAEVLQDAIATTVMSVNGLFMAPTQQGPSRDSSTPEPSRIREGREIDHVQAVERVSE
jgi:hypothetical protein